MDNLQLRSLIKKSGELELSLMKVPVADPAPDEIVVRVESTPINPSDLGLLLGPADLSTAVASGTKDMPVVTAKVPEAMLRAVAARADESMPVGNEGAGTVVKAGSSPQAQALMGKMVAILGGAMYAQYRTVKAVAALPYGACDGGDYAARGSYRAGSHGGGIEPRADAQQDLHQGRRWPGQHRP
jgi:NADPH:quinone reductase-like Zn-dependent oxidoreductase